MKRSIFALISLGALTVLIFQNCGNDVSFKELPRCVRGEKFGVWLDRDESGVIKDEDYQGHVVAFGGAVDAATNYGYESASAHIQNGPAPQDQKLNVFFYRAPESRRLRFTWPAIGEAVRYVVQFAPDSNFALDATNPDDFLLEFPVRGTSFEWAAYSPRVYYWRVAGKKANPNFSEVDDREFVNTSPAYASTSTILDLTNINSADLGSIQDRVQLFHMDEHLALNLFANRNVTPGVDIQNGRGELDINIISTGNDMLERFLLLDDGLSLSDIFDRFEFASTESVNFNINTRYGNNTDGAVIGPFYGTDYKIQVKINKAGNANYGRFHSADGTSFSLDESIAGTAFIIERAGYEECVGM